MEFIPFNAEIKRTEATVEEIETGKKFRVSKGAPQIILELSDSNKDKVEEEANKKIDEYAEGG